MRPLFRKPDGSLDPDCADINRHIIDADIRALRLALGLAVLVIILVGFAALNIAQAKTPEIKPDLHDRLPQKAEAKRDCRVIIGRGIYFARTPDGQIVPMSIRTRC